MTSPLFCARHYHGGQVVLVEPCPWCRIETLEAMLRHAEADAEQAIHYTEMERDAARAVARTLAHAWRHDSRPPDEVVREAEGYPAMPEEKGSA